MYGTSVKLVDTCTDGPPRNDPLLARLGADGVMVGSVSASPPPWARSLADH